MARRWSLLLMVLAATFASGVAVAETDFPVIGGSGTGGFEDRCPPGQYLLSIDGRAGAWVDQVMIVCAVVQRANDGSGWIVTSVFDPYHGPMRGGQGGAPTGASCGTGGGVVRGIWPHMTPGNRQVKYVDIWCIDMTDRTGGTARFNTFTNPATDVNGGSDQPQQQQCPSGEMGVGLRGRYGADVNAISLICGTFNPPMQPSRFTNDPAPPPAPPKPVQVAQNPPADSGGPVFVPTTPPATATMPNPVPGPFFGPWDISVSDGTKFSVNLSQKTGGLTTNFAATMQGATGSIRGRTLNKTHVQFNFTLSGAQGEIQVELAPDGMSFIGAGHLGDGTPVTWTGERPQTGAAPGAQPGQPANGGQ